MTNRNANTNVHNVHTVNNYDYANSPTNDGHNARR